MTVSSMRWRRRARRVDYDRGSTLMREGDSDDSLVVIAEGDVNVSVAGRPETVATLGEGDIVGEMSLLTGAPRSATVTVVRPVVALEIGKADLEPLLIMSPSLFERFAAVVEKRRGRTRPDLRPELRRALSLLAGPARRRDARLLRAVVQDCLERPPRAAGLEKTLGHRFTIASASSGSAVGRDRNRPPSLSDRARLSIRPHCPSRARFLLHELRRNAR